MTWRFTQSELEAYLEELLAPEEMAAIEAALRSQPELGQQLASINARQNSGAHSVGEIWRRRRISCLSREQLGSYLLGAASRERAAYVTFHIEKVGCRFCRANLEDLKRQQQESAEIAVSRRKKYFQSSAGYLGRKRS